MKIEMEKDCMDCDLKDKTMPNEYCSEKCVDNIISLRKRKFRI